MTVNGWGQRPRAWDEVAAGSAPVAITIRCSGTTKGCNRVLGYVYNTTEGLLLVSYATAPDLGPDARQHRIERERRWSADDAPLRWDRTMAATVELLDLIAEPVHMGCKKHPNREDLNLAELRRDIGNHEPEHRVPPSA